MKVRKSLRDRLTASTPSKKDTDFDAMREWESSQTLPVADESMRSPMSPTSAQMPLRPSKGTQSDANGPMQHVSSNTIGASTIRAVPQEEDDGVQSSKGAPSADDLVPHFARLDVRNASNDPEANADAESHTQYTIQRKPLPSLPDENAPETDENDLDELQSEEFETWRSFEQSRELEGELGVEGQVDLSNTKDTEVVTRYAPAVTHETITVDHHSVLEQQITREIHQDHIFHRILPVEEVEVLPARHFVSDSKGALREVSEDQLPDRAHKNVQNAVVEAFQSSLPKTVSTAGRRQFTAREFPGEEGDLKEYVDSEGVQRSERWWVYPPALETGGRDSGQTHPFYFDSSKIKEDRSRNK